MARKGKGQGRGQGMPTGRGSGRSGGGGCGGGGAGLGAGGFCICLTCGQRTPHQMGTPCLNERCPGCGAAMVREGSPHHQEVERRRAEREPAR